MSVSLKDYIQKLVDKTECEQTSEVLSRITELFDSVAHGEQGHRDWLERAIESHFLGLPLPEYVAK
jgi:rubrerythrin